VFNEVSKVTATSHSGFDIPGDLINLPYPLPGCARIIAKGGPLTIVALGSSSTAGAYASSPAASYPARLEFELRLRFPSVGIKVLNRGENGEDVAENLARFDKSVTAEHPNLVLWQVGTNWLMQDRPLEEFKSLVIDGLKRVQSIASETVLIDTQYAPALVSKPNFPSFVKLLTTIGQQYHVSMFRRFLIMQYWHTNLQIQLDTFLSSDGLHMNDWSYRYMAKLLAKGLADVFVPPKLT
jgi:acyl-CoA thioesterase I